MAIAVAYRSMPPMRRISAAGLTAISGLSLGPSASVPAKRNRYDARATHLLENRNCPPAVVVAVPTFDHVAGPAPVRSHTSLRPLPPPLSVPVISNEESSAGAREVVRTLTLVAVGKE